MFSCGNGSKKNSQTNFHILRIHVSFCVKHEIYASLQKLGHTDIIDMGSLLSQKQLSLTYHISYQTGKRLR